MDCAWGNSVGRALNWGAEDREFDLWARLALRVYNNLEKNVMLHWSYKQLDLRLAPMTKINRNSGPVSRSRRKTVSSNGTWC